MECEVEMVYRQVKRQLILDQEPVQVAVLAQHPPHCGGLAGSGLCSERAVHDSLLHIADDAPQIAL